jgi:hypothetical protein
MGKWLRSSWRYVLPSVPPLAYCLVPVREDAIQIARVDVMTCCVWKISLCVAQGAEKIFAFEDAATVDYSGATEITFDVWRDGIGGASLLSYSMTDDEIILVADNRFQFTLAGSVSALLPPGPHHAEAWVTLSTGARRLVGMGSFTVTDTRRHDA